MNKALSKLRVAALIDLPRSAVSGGHVKCWERLAGASAAGDLPLDLTVYFSGSDQTEILGAGTRIRQLPPVFSTERLKWILPYVPDHTDLAPYHWSLARELQNYDVIHTTDGFFAFAQTAEKISKKNHIPLVTSFHTDTPAYTRVFTKATIERLFGADSLIARKLVGEWKVPEKKERDMLKRLTRHVAACSAALITRDEDRVFSERILSTDKTHALRLGVDKKMFGTHRRDREGIEADYRIPAGRIVALFVGRLDVGKNIYTLIEAVEKLRAEGVFLHVVAAGIGPAAADLRARLGDAVSVPGFVAPDELARLYASVDLLALTSEVEIRSMAGVEAMASGCPVLVSRKSGIAELFDHTPAMQVVESGVTEWMAALRGFAKNAEKRAAMRAAAEDYGQTKLASWFDVLAEDLFAVWKKAADSAKR